MTIDDVANSFSISGLLDAGTQTASRFPVKEIPLEGIQEHPGNVAYSMDPEGIAKLAESIKADGLTDLPLVRRLPGGGFQMISGHRRMAAYRLLAESNIAYSKLPCRISADVTDEQALVLLHTANFFTRSLTVTERAAATKALGLQVEQMRADDPSLAGMRTEDVKALIVEEMTGRKVSGKTIKREEALAQKLEELTSEWRAEADAGHVSASSVVKLAGLTQESQSELHRTWADMPRNKRETTRIIDEAVLESHPTVSETPSIPAADKRLATAEKALGRFVANLPKNLSAADSEAISRIADLARQAADAVSGLPKPSRAVGNPSDSNRSE
ncbi:ParB/RepB/Spo0J family partition protein [Slackia isoflavoniconvertens]|uniref:ParB/RepB/Spo0J family partition protein n=1 Tax=Slackia isoflavoniconvertens TaxID=572010 RepID=UPI003F97B1DE